MCAPEKRPPSLKCGRGSGEVIQASGTGPQTLAPQHPFMRRERPPGLLQRGKPASQGCRRGDDRRRVRWEHCANAEAAHSLRQKNILRPGRLPTPTGLVPATVRSAVGGDSPSTRGVSNHRSEMVEGRGAAQLPASDGTVGPGRRSGSPAPVRRLGDLPLVHDVRHVGQGVRLPARPSKTWNLNRTATPGSQWNVSSYTVRGLVNRTECKFEVRTLRKGLESPAISAKATLPA